MQQKINNINKLPELIVTGNQHASHSENIELHIALQVPEPSHKNHKN